MAKLSGVLALVGVLLGGLLFGSTEAGATTKSNYQLLQRRNFSNHPAKGFETCLKKSIDLSKLPSSQKYSWSDDFPEERSAYVVSYGSSFSGKFYWSVCVYGLRGDKHSGDTYDYYMNSEMTQESTRCEETGHCTTYHLSNYYLFSGGRNITWGSTLAAMPADYCQPTQSGSSCDQTAFVSVTKS